MQYLSHLWRDTNSVTLTSRSFQNEESRQYKTLMFVMIVRKLKSALKISKIKQFNINLPVNQGRHSVSEIVFVDLRDGQLPVSVNYVGDGRITPVDKFARDKRVFVKMWKNKYYFSIKTFRVRTSHNAADTYKYISGVKLNAVSCWFYLIYDVTQFPLTSRSSQNDSQQYKTLPHNQYDR